MTNPKKHQTKNIKSPTDNPRRRKSLSWNQLHDAKKHPLTSMLRRFSLAPKLDGDDRSDSQSSLRHSHLPGKENHSVQNTTSSQPPKRESSSPTSLGIGEWDIKQASLEKSKKTKEAIEERKQAALEETRKKQADWKLRVSHFQSSVEKIRAQGFKDLIHIDPNDVALVKNLLSKPLEEYHTNDELPLGEKISLRLFTKDGQIYFNKMRELLNPTNTIANIKPTILGTNKSGMDNIYYAYIIVLTKVSSHGKSLNKLEFRICPGIKGAHLNMVSNKAKPSCKENKNILAAGELAIRDGKCIFASDKSGGFNLTGNRITPFNNHQQEEIFRAFFPKDLFTGHFFHWVNDPDYIEQFKKETGFDYPTEGKSVAKSVNSPALFPKANSQLTRSLDEVEGKKNNKPAP